MNADKRALSTSAFMGVHLCAVAILSLQFDSDFRNQDFLCRCSAEVDGFASDFDDH